MCQPGASQGLHFPLLQGGLAWFTLKAWLSPSGWSPRVWVAPRGPGSRLHPAPQRGKQTPREEKPPDWSPQGVHSTNT